MYCGTHDLPLREEDKNEEVLLRVKIDSGNKILKNYLENGYKMLNIHLQKYQMTF